MLQTTSVFDRIAKNFLARIQILQGGSSSSKTYSILQYLIYLASQSKRSLIISVVSETMPHLKRGAMRDFFNIIGDSYDRASHNKTENQYKIHNSTIEFFSADNSGRVRGPRRDILFLNEANNIQYDTYIQLEIRTRKKIFIDFNPVEDFWAHKLVGTEGVSFDISTYLDNQCIPKEIVKSIESKRYNPDGSESDWWRVYGKGQIGTKEGVIFSNWKQDDFPAEFHVLPTHGMDFGFSNDPSVFLRVHMIQDDLWIKQLIYKTGLTTEDLCNKMDSLDLIKKQTAIFADPSDPRSIEAISRKGWPIRKATFKGSGSVLTGIDWLQSKRMHIDKGSVDVIKELRNYHWIRNQSTGTYSNVPIDDFNHAIDALRYGCSYKIKTNQITTKRIAI